MTPFAGLHNLRRVLCLGAHSDDVEIGAGGTLLRLMEASPRCAVTWVVLSGDERRHDEARASFDLFTERHAATKSLICHAFPDTLFPTRFADLKSAFNDLKHLDPDLVLTHARKDAHQDHRTVNALTWNAFRSTQVWEYEVPKWDGDLGRPNLYVPLTDEQADRKIELLMAAFASQRSKHWFDAETFRGLMRLRGLESNARYAEAFTARKLVV